MEALFTKETLIKVVNGLKVEIGEVNSLRDERSRQIKEDILSSFPEWSEVHVFGSQLTGTATKDSDFDLYIDKDGRSYYSELNHDIQETSIKKLYSAFTEPHSKFKFIVGLIETRVPILRAKHIRTNIDCDISFRSGLSVENSCLTRQLLSSDFRVSWLVITIKWWMHSNKLLGSNKFTSHATTWLMFFYLMHIQPKILSPVLDMKKGSPHCEIEGWDCRFNRNFNSSGHLKNPNVYTRFRLLADFFKYYGNFDFEKIVLCPLTDSLIPRKDFDVLTVPPAYSPYVNKIKKHRDAERLCTTSPICLQDPFNLSHNITKHVTKDDLVKFICLCQGSAGLCENWAYD